ncbi:DUF255 domain-containing protein [Galbibacter sp. EGI 63066]|uniref:thioredoxin family protein n=1 Tax=Galbibacter sp. EGI 63066 TaxID=2993559 RepID=UPI002248ECD1|nr:DUF255 domain-containing protein [Galbibacter sp. EGI 63066]MCX2679232.1 DUF255 domain-containing protein [Galbibacter sp. EGI 63066]
MKTKTPVLIIALTFLFVLSTEAQEIKWMSWSEAIEKTDAEENPKKIFVDIYTDWCGWCKKMDKNTFNDPEVATYMNKTFYMVKMNAEGKEDIVYKDRTYKYISQGKKGYHELAAALLQGRMSFPTVVFINEQQQLISPVPGYMKPEGFLKIAKYFGDDIYKTTSWTDYDAEKSK